MYYLFSKIKGADQLHLCFHMYANIRFSHDMAGIGPLFQYEYYDCKP